MNTLAQYPHSISYVSCTCAVLHRQISVCIFSCYACVVISNRNATVSLHWSRSVSDSVLAAYQIVSNNILYMYVTVCRRSHVSSTITLSDICVYIYMYSNVSISNSLNKLSRYQICKLVNCDRSSHKIILLNTSPFYVLRREQFTLLSQTNRT